MSAILQVWCACIHTVSSTLCCHPDKNAGGVGGSRLEASDFPLTQAHLAGLGLCSMLLGKELISPERKLLSSPQPQGLKVVEGATGSYQPDKPTQELLAAGQKVSQAEGVWRASNSKNITELLLRRLQFKGLIRTDIKTSPSSGMFGTLHQCVVVMSRGSNTCTTLISSLTSSASNHYIKGT